MGTKFSDFMKEIEKEAEAEGPEAVEELCLIRKFFQEEMKKPAMRRSNACMISCRCSRCNPGTL